MVIGTPEVWLLSAYHAASHAIWANWLTTRVDGFVWQPLLLPGRYFRWRIRGNPLSWLDSLPAGTPDLIVATSMVDLATLKGLHPRLAPVPAYYYFHENQFAYPISDGQVTSVDAQVVQLYGALSAQRLLFNSVFNRDSFLDGVDAFLHKMPDALCYPEQYPVAYRYPAADRDALVARLVTWLTEDLPPPVDVTSWYGSRLGEAWRDLLRQGCP